MAIAGIPSNFIVQQANRQVLVSWDLASGATSYSVQRSLDGITYSSLATPTAPHYLDTAVTVGTQYYYQVASVNGSGTSAYTNPQNVVPTPTGEMSLGEVRNRSQQRADRLNSSFVGTSEWNFFINQAMFELYDLLITADEDYYVATPAQFTTQGTQYIYPLPDGITTFTNTAGASFAAPPFYKLKGVDLGISNANNAWATVRKFMFESRNQFVYPNTTSTIYGVFNLQYRLVGLSQIEFIPTPSANQPIRLWYIPRLASLLADNDLTNIGISGWLQYVIVRAAKYALDKEESDTSKLDSELIFLKARIEETAVNRDAGQPDRITDVRNNGYNGTGNGWGGFGPIGGW